MCNFYKLNSEMLKFTENDIDELRFNQLIIRKENLQRLNKNDPLEKGLFRMTFRTVSTDLDITLGKARVLVKKFEDMGIIKRIKASKKVKEGSIYAYLSVYEENFKEDYNTLNNTLNNTVKASDCNNYNNINNTVNNTVSNTSKKDNIKRVNKNTYSETSSEVKIAKYLYELILKNNAKAKKPNFQKWADTINKLMRIDGRSEEEIYKVIDFSQNDDFWSSNILSTNALRKHFDKLYIKANKKSPAKTGAKNNTYTNSICNSQANNSRMIEINNFK